MSSSPARNIALTPVMEAYIRAQVAPEHYANASDVVWSEFRLLMEPEQAVARLKSAGPRGQPSR